MHCFVFCLAMLAAFAAPVFASGQLDPRFDGDGVLAIDASISDMFVGQDTLRGGLIDSAGRYVGVGSAIGGTGRKGSVIRVSSTGALDASFGVGGIVRIPALDGYNAQIWTDVAEQPDGKLVLAGYSGEIAVGPGDNSRAYVCRLMPNGSLDASFGNAGCTQPPFWFESNNDKVFAMQLQPDGRIVLLGWTEINGINHNYVVARLDSDGSYDGCFGDITCQTGGLLIEPEPPSDLPSFTPNALALAPDGRIVLAGFSQNGGRDMAAIRLLPTGEVDQGFGNGGHRLVAFNGGGTDADEAEAVAVNGNGSIVLAGTVTNNFGRHIGIAKLQANGNLDPSFGTGGRRTTFFNDVSPSHIPTRVLFQADGKLLLSGFTDDTQFSGPPVDCGIMRLLPNGQLDPVFGVDGKLNIDGGRGLEQPRNEGCFGLAADGRSIVLFGQRIPNGAPHDYSLFLKLDQDDVFRDGYETPSP